jgi:hypothetical protein
LQPRMMIVTIQRGGIQSIVRGFEVSRWRLVRDAGSGIAHLVEDMRMRKRLSILVGLSSTFALGVLVTLGMASPSPAQLEPESFTILKEALNQNPPTPAYAVRMLLKYQDPHDRRNLHETWLRSLVAKANGTQAEKRKRLEELLDAFDGAFDAVDGATPMARKFIRLRDELLARQIAENEIERSAAVLVERLRALSDTGRDVLREYGRLTKRSITKIVK